MSILFQPKKLGTIELENRFIRSAVAESMALVNGGITDELVKLYQDLAQGEIGLLIMGFSYVHPLGRAAKYQTGIYNDDLIEGFKRVVNAVHEERGKIAIQLVHAGMMANPDLIGRIPLGASKKVRIPITGVTPVEMDEDQIQDVIQSFGMATKRAFECDIDAIQIHAAHGYLINQFISPFFNRREDDWGGSDETRFRFLEEIILECKKNIPNNKPLLVKINSNDYTEKPGMTPELAAKYAKWLVELGIDALEVSCGTVYFSAFNMVRGNIPVNEMMQAMPEQLRTALKPIFNGLIGKFDLYAPYNLAAAKVIKPEMGDVPLILVGGLRKLRDMEKIIKNNHADFISMARPFIREPGLIKAFREGIKSEASCISCNRCFAAGMNEFPTKCYVNQFPQKEL